LSEDLKLVQLVQAYGDKAWTKVSGSMGNRSDVQCRYHYHQLAKDMPQLLQIASQGGFPGTGFARPIAVKPVFQGMPHGRFSMPIRLPIGDGIGEVGVQRRRASQFALGVLPRERIVEEGRGGEMRSDEEVREPVVQQRGGTAIGSIASLLNSH
jgi:hypothetical protein